MRRCKCKFRYVVRYARVRAPRFSGPLRDYTGNDMVAAVYACPCRRGPVGPVRHDSPSYGNDGGQDANRS